MQQRSLLFFLPAEIRHITDKIKKKGSKNMTKINELKMRAAMTIRNDKANPLTVLSCKILLNLLYYIQTTMLMMQAAKYSIRIFRLKHMQYCLVLKGKLLMAKHDCETREKWKYRLRRIHYEIFRMFNFFFAAIWMVLAVCRIINYDFSMQSNEVLRYSYFAFAVLILSVPAIVSTNEYREWVCERKPGASVLYISMYIFVYVAEFALILSFLM